MDWADEAVNEMQANDHHDIAAALRKAKADGMREALDWLISDDGILCSMELIESTLRSRAARLEQPR